MVAQTPIQAAYTANLFVQVDSDLCMYCTVYAEGQTSKFNFIDACDHAHLIYTTVSWHRKNLGIHVYGLGFTQTTRLES